MLAGCTHLLVTAVPSTLRINTPSAWSKPQHDAVHRQGRTPLEVPIVFTIVPDPVGAGFVDSLSRPGGNATGFASFIRDGGKCPRTSTPRASFAGPQGSCYRTRPSKIQSYRERRAS